MKINKCIDCNAIIGNYTTRCRSCEAKRKHREGILNNKGINHPMYGKSNVAVIGDKNHNWKGGISKNRIHCKDCGKELGMKAVFKGTERCIDCAARIKSGKNHWNYKDGTAGIYPLEFNDKLKSKIRTRDNYECQNCGMTEEEHLIVMGKVLSVHHIDYNKENCEDNNLTTLCEPCNNRANFNREYWTEFYQQKVKIA